MAITTVEPFGINSSNAYTFGSVTATGNVTGNYFIGNGSQLTGIAESYGNANVVANLAALGSNPVSTTGNVTGGNLLTSGLISATGNVTGNYILGNGALLTGVITSVANINNGTSNVTVVSSGGNVSVGVGGTGNIVVWATTGEYVTGVVSASGNITGSNLVTGGVITATGNIQGGNLVTTGSITTTGNIQGAIVFTTANGTGQNVKIGDDVWIGDINAGNYMRFSGVSDGTQAYVIFGNSDSTALGRSGTGPLTYGGQFSATGNITAPLIITTNNNSGLNIKIGDDAWIGDKNISNGVAITGVADATAGYLAFGSDAVALGRTGTGALTWGAAFSASGNVTGGNLLTGGLISATSTITSAANITGGNLLTGGLISATSTITSAANVIANNVMATNIVNVASHTGSVVSVSANVTGGNLLTAGQISATGNITAGNIIVTGVVTDNIGNLELQSAAANGNINLTPNGTGNVYSGSNVLVTGLITATGNIAGNFFIGNGSLLTGISGGGGSGGSYIVNGTSNIAIVSSGGNATANIGGTANVLVLANTGSYVTGLISASGNVTGGNILTAGLISATGNVNGGNLRTGGLISATSTITSAANVTGGNLTTAGAISATGNISSNAGLYSIAAVDTNKTVIYGDMGTNDQFRIQIGGNTNAGFVEFATADDASEPIYFRQYTGVFTTATRTLTLLDGSGNSLFPGMVSATSNVIGGNIRTAGLISATGNVTGGNLVSAGQITVTGNATGGNINTAGQVTATGNITAAAFLSTNNNSGFNYKIGDDVWIGDRNITNGFAITGINSSTAGYIQFGNDTALLGRTSTGALTWTAAFSVTANVTGGNILTAGLVSATGNVTGGNIRTAGLISATGNVTGNFFVGNGSALTGIGGGTSISSGNSNVAVVAANSNVSVGVGGTSNIAVFATTGEYVTGLLSVSGNILGGNITTGAGSGGNITGANVISCTNIKTTANTVANLPAAATVGAGARAFVTDATSVTFAATAVGGAANAVPVWTDGTTWKIG